MGKKGKKQQKKIETVQEVKDEKLNHLIEVIGYFEHVRVAPPLFSKNLEETLKILEEKKDYFKNLP